jgi:hypothetical protein
MATPIEYVFVVKQSTTINTANKNFIAAPSVLLKKTFFIFAISSFLYDTLTPKVSQKK